MPSVVPNPRPAPLEVTSNGLPPPPRFCVAEALLVDPGVEWLTVECCERLVVVSIVVEMAVGALECCEGLLVVTMVPEMAV